MISFILTLIAVGAALMVMASSFAAGRRYDETKAASVQPEVSKRAGAALLYGLVAVVVAFCAGRWA